jgi:3-oxoacyl-[acyl-carrier-protein] synthase-3
MRRSKIVGTGHYLPERVVTNDDLSKMVDTNDEWIQQRTGICERHWAADDEAASDMAVCAANAALEDAGVSAKEIDFILCATVCADHYFPSTACIIQDRIGAGPIGASDLNAACSGFIYGLQMANALIQAGAHDTILVVGVEKLSVYIDFEKRDTAVLFGDGAGAVVLRAEEGEEGILSTYTGADGSAKEILWVPSGGSRTPITPENINDIERGIVMDGQSLYKRAVASFVNSVEHAMENSGVSMEDIDLFIPHQANIRIIQSAATRLKFPEEKIFVNLDKTGNTSAASIPIALDQACRAGRVKKGDTILLAAFGAGLTWASAIIRW